MRNRSRTWLLAALLAAAPAMAALPPEFTPFLDFVDGTNPVPSVDVPEVGTIESISVLDDDFALPAGMTTSDGSTVIPAGTPILDLERPMLEAMVVDDFLVLVSGFLDTSLGPEERNYEVVVTRVDTRNFPEVSLELRLYPRDIRAPLLTDALLAGYGVTVRERVSAREPVPGGSRTTEERTVPAGDFTSSPPVQLCHTDPVAMTVAIDTSCTMQRSLPELRDSAVNFMSWVLDGGRTAPTGDAISVFAFDGAAQSRSPDFTEADLFYPHASAPPDAITDTEALDVDRPCRGRPVFTSMREELDRLATYAVDPAQQWMLAVFSDFKDTTPRSEEDALIAAIESSPATVVGLGFGNVHEGKVGRVFDIQPDGTAGRGIFIRASQTDPEGALRKVYESSGRTYCVKYRSRFPNHFNEVVELELELQDPGVPGPDGISRGRARYTLPLVVPEDMRDVRIFLPLVDEQYAALRGDLGASATVRLDYVDPRPDAGVSPEPSRGPSPEFTLDPADLQAALDDLDDSAGEEALGKGLWLRPAELGDAWAEVFQVPTHFEAPDPADADGAVTMMDLPHWALALEFDGPVMGTEPYEASTILAVQDRTPPHVFLRLNPETGRAPASLWFREDTVDVDPTPLIAGLGSGDRGRLDSAVVRPEGVGPKLGRIQYQWSDGEGTVSEGTVTGQVWSRPDPSDPTALPVSGVTNPSGDPNALFQPPDYEDGGLEMAAGVRVSVQVLARDNYAHLAGAASAGSPDVAVWTDRQTSGPDGPRDARFDVNRPAAQQGSIAPPFFPLVSRADLAADPRRAGVTWWIESAADRDRFAELDGIPFFQYPTEDAEVMLALSEAGVVTPPFPVRMFHVYAQDGQGNATAFSLPVFVTGTQFQATRVSTSGGRR